MKVFVTGGAGFIGRWLLRLLPADVDVVVVDSLEEEVHGSRPAFPEDVRVRATCLHCDVRDVEGWRLAAAGADVVVHLAALTGTGRSMYQQRRYIEHNVLGTSALCEGLAGIHPGPRRVILASSRAVYGEGAFLDRDLRVHPAPRRDEALAAGRWEVENALGVPLRPVPTREDAPLQPTSVYGMTKMWQEQLMSLFASTRGGECLMLRFQNVYGPLQALENPYTGILGVLTNGIVRQGRVELFEDGRMTRDFVFVADVARALVAGITHPGPLTGTINVGSGGSLSLRELTALIADVAEKDPLVCCSGRYRLGDVRHASADMSAYEAAIGPWHPVALRDGLREYLRWFTEQPAPGSSALAASLTEMVDCGLLLEGKP